MPEYVFAYHGGKTPDPPAEPQRYIKRWHAWKAGYHSVFTDFNAVLGQSYTISATGAVNHGGVNPLSGISVVKAEHIEQGSALRSAVHFWII